MHTILKLLFCITAVSLFSSCSKKNEVNSHAGKFYLFEDASIQLDATAVKDSFSLGKFSVCQHKFANIGFTKSVFWLAFYLDSNQSQQDVYLTIGDPSINRIDLYYAGTDSVKKLFTTGDYFPYAQRPFPSVNYSFPINREGLYFARIDKHNESLQLNFDILEEESLLINENDNNLFFFLGSGAVLLLIIFGIYLFIIEREWLYFFYLLYVTAGWLWVLANSGHAFKYLWPDEVWFASKARVVLVLISLVLSQRFMELYVGGIKRPGLKKLLRVLSYLLLAFTILILFAKYEWNQYSSWMYLQFVPPFTMLIYVITLVATLAVQSVKGNKLSLFYLIAISTLALMSIIQVGFYVAHMPENFVTHYGNGIGYLVEVIILTAGLAYRFNQYKKEKEKVLIAMNRQQVENTKILMEVQASERSQIADQLHDVAGSLLSAARLNVSSLIEKKYLQNQEGVIQLKKAEEALTLVSETVRTLSHALSPVMLSEVGFKTAIEKVVSIFNSSGKAKIELIVLGFEEYNAQHQQLYNTLYNILYELLNNAFKHANAKHILVQLSEYEDAFSMIVEDDGVGMNKDLNESEKTHGMSSIKSKVDYLKGSIIFEENTPKGLIVTIEIPKFQYA